MTSLAPFAGLCAATALMLAACYNPQIEDGALKCSAKFECPSGFTCLTSDNHCHKQGGETGGDGAAGGGRPPMAGPPMAAARSVRLPPARTAPSTAARPGSTASAIPCARPGCKCDERCMLEKTGPACRTQAAPFAAQYERCEPTADTCRLASSAFEELVNRPDCARSLLPPVPHRRSMSDGSQCTDDVTLGATWWARAAASRPENCNPYNRAPCAVPAARPLPAFACYTVPRTPDLTACQCAGVILTGMACANYFDCEPGSECVAIGAVKICRKVCLVGALAATPAPARSLRPAPPRRRHKYGYCH